MPATSAGTVATKLNASEFTPAHPAVWLLLNSQDQLYSLFADSLRLQSDAYESEVAPKVHLLALVRTELHARASQLHPGGRAQSCSAFTARQVVAIALLETAYPAQRLHSGERHCTDHCACGCEGAILHTLYICLPGLRGCPTIYKLYVGEKIAMARAHFTFLRL